MATLLDVDDERARGSERGERGLLLKLILIINSNVGNKLNKGKVHR